MTMPSAPRLDQRRTEDFLAELIERAQAWIPSWSVADDDPDFGRTLLAIASRFSSEVAERLDGVGDKMRAGFLDWLAVAGQAARPARMPVVFKLTNNAPAPIPASSPIRMQADTGGLPVTFETETDVQLVPGTLDMVVGVDADKDAYYLPPPRISDLSPLEPSPTQWRLKSFAAAKSNKLQLDPDAGLAIGTIIELAGSQYKVTGVEGDIVTIDPPLSQSAETEVINKVTSFAPFDGAAHNWQEHVLYLGDLDLLNIEAPASIEVSQAKNLVTGFRWEYWGKVDGQDEPAWQTLTVADDDQQKDVPGLLLLKEKKGSIEPLVINGKNGRWIRAYLQKATVSKPQLSAQKLALKINGLQCGKPPDCPSATQIESPPSDAMANTTPLVLSGPFYPLGREPRQFDAFYLGNNEAFSKVNATVQLCFEMADPTFQALSAVLPIQNINWGNVLAGIGADRSLHLFSFDAGSRSLAKFRDRDQLQPPSPQYLAGPQQGNPVSLDRKPAWRLPIWSDGTDFIVGTTAGLNVWLWQETLIAPQSGWKSFGNLPTTPVSGASADALVYLGSALPSVLLVALYNGKLFTTLASSPQWQEVPTQNGAAAVVLKAIVPVFQETAPGVWNPPNQASELVGVGDDHLLYDVDVNGQCTPIGPNNVSYAVPPLAVKRFSTEKIIAFTQADSHSISTFHSANGVGELLLPGDESVLGFDVSLATDINIVASVNKPGADYLASWLPPDAFGNIEVFRSDIPAGIGDAGGAPTLLSGFVIVPGKHGDEFLANIDFTRRFEITANVKAGVVASGSPPGLLPNDTVTLDVGNPFPTHLITEAGTTKDNETLYPLDGAFMPGSSGAIYGFRSSGTPKIGDLKKSTSTLTLDAADHETVQGTLLLIEDEVFRVTALSAGGKATLDHAPAADNHNADYWNSLPITGRLAPFLRLDSSNNNWDAAILDQASLVFSGADPSRQTAKAFSVVSFNRPILVVLNEDWKTPPVSMTIVVDGAAGSWLHLLGDTSSNPELSWEYWNGKGWWKLNITKEQTQNLKSSGAIQFTVATDIASSDWSGKTNFWIRARLIGGDYGQAKVVVTTTPVGSTGATQQTIDRSLTDIHAPSVVSLQISYKICDAATPAYVITQDSGSTRDQSDANLTGGAVVEAFVPIGLTLGRLSGQLPASLAAAECPPPCDCPSSSSTASSPANVSPLAIAAVPAVTGRAVLLGLTKPPSGAPVNILVIVDQERNHDAFAPLKVEALVGDRFIPIVTKDATRVLGETGVLSLAFALEPTPRELFGKDLCWIRFTPHIAAAGEWKPALSGTYLNGVWASATETLTRELVGSSEGAPSLTLSLARPPLLLNTLELRVKEPLSDEERTALLNQDKNLVKSAVQDLPGDWVLWKQVIDPADASATDRVYALDESLGEIRFGDGQHGMIPPIGKDSIVAFQYQRTEAGPDDNGPVSGNAIAPRTQLNLVSPVPTVESVMAADQAAGGAPPEPIDHVLRFGNARLRHRDRVVSARDLEEIAVGSSPKIVQAHCMMRAGGVRLIVVMKGDDPAPSAADTRELTRFLLSAAPLALAGANVLRIEPPKVRRLRLSLQLQIDDLDNAGEVAKAAADKLQALIDPATGGVTKDGWPLGLNPTETDIAVALIDTPHLQSIEQVQLIESVDEHTERLWPTSLRPDELALPAKDPVRIEFVAPEVRA
jgi:hypothetical protein